MEFRSFILRKLAAKSRWCNTPQIIKFYKAIVLPVWHYGCLLLAHKCGNFWDGFRKSVGQTIASIAGVPRSMNREVLMDHTNMQDIEISLKEMAKKRILSILKTSPLSDELCNHQNINTHTTSYYSSPIRAIIKDEDWEEITAYKLGDTNTQA